MVGSLVYFCGPQLFWGACYGLSGTTVTFTQASMCIRFIRKENEAQRGKRVGMEAQVTAPGTFLHHLACLTPGLHLWNGSGGHRTGHSGAQQLGKDPPSPLSPNNRDATDRGGCLSRPGGSAVPSLTGTTEGTLLWYVTPRPLPHLSRAFCAY